MIHSVPRTNMRTLNTFIAVLALNATACAQSLATARLSDGNLISIDGYGAKAKVEIKCLSKNAVKQLTGSDIPPDVSEVSCYTVALVSSDSSSISKAITSYANAEQELWSLVAGGPGGPAPAAIPQLSAEERFARDVVDAFVADATALPQDQVVERATKTVAGMSAETKRLVKQTLSADIQALRASDAKADVINSLVAVKSKLEE